MTMTNSPTDSAGPALARLPSAHRAGAYDFGIDTTSRPLGEALRDYVSEVRGGDLGALPALLTLGSLVILFALVSSDFLTLNNLTNVVQQGAGQTIIAMGLIYVLLLGEI